MYLKKIFKLLSFKHRNNDIKIIKNIEEIVLETFENELIQVFINIMNNAKDALDSCEEKLLFIDAYEDKEKIIIEIKDNAGGIQKRHIHRVFRLFYNQTQISRNRNRALYGQRDINAPYEWQY